MRLPRAIALSYVGMADMLPWGTYLAVILGAALRTWGFGPLGEQCSPPAAVDPSAFRLTPERLFQELLGVIRGCSAFRMTEEGSIVRQSERWRFHGAAPPRFHCARPPTLDADRNGELGPSAGPLRAVGVGYRRFLCQNEVPTAA